MNTETIEVKRIPGLVGFLGNYFVEGKSRQSPWKSEQSLTLVLHSFKAHQGIIFGEAKHTVTARHICRITDGHRDF